MDSESSETNLVIITKRDRLKIFCKLYWKNLVFFITPCMLSPITFVNDKAAYKCFFIFLITVVYWIADILHPSVISLVPLALYSIVDMREENESQAYIMNELLDCLAAMMLITAIEYSKINRRVALKMLLILGYSHYRLSFVLFFTTMFLSMWMSDIIACGLMIPIVYTILTELEKMGILEVYQTVGKAKQKTERHEQSFPRPSEFTIFYFLGIAYSSSIGGMATITGCHANQIFKNYCEILFPESPKIEFPHFMLLNLPGVLLMETLLYMWMNSYFMGMFRANSSIALEIGMSEEETQYMNTLLSRQYELMGKMTFHEIIVGSIAVVTGIFQLTLNSAYLAHWSPSHSHSHIKTSAPCIITVILLFVSPINLDFLKFFEKRTNGNTEPLPQSPSKACLSWNLVRDNVHWNVLFTIGGSCFIFAALKDSDMTSELEKFLLLFKSWPTSALLLVVIIFCKIFTEFASNPCVAYCLLPNIARMSVKSGINPHHLMMAATLSCSLPFHLITGSPTNAMIASYVHIPHGKMMSAGVGPSVIAVLVTWFTAAVWARAVWTDISDDPAWADLNTLREMP